MKRIETERLILRSWTIEDAEDLYEYAKDERVGPKAGWPTHKSIMESECIIKMFIETKEVFAIEMKELSKVIGSIGIHNRKPDEHLAGLRQAEIGYVLNPKFWGQGIMPEAVNAVKDYCFNVLCLDLIWCGHFDKNIQSEKVIKKTGFEYQFLKEKIYEKLDNKKIDVAYYNIFNPSQEKMKIKPRE